MGRFGPGAIWGPIISPRSITLVTDLGLLGAAIYRAVLNRPAIETQSPEQGGGRRCLLNLQDRLWFRAINSCLLSALAETNALNSSLAFASFASPGPGYAAAACPVVAHMPWRSGSYTSPHTQSRCSRTASFRATATAALFFAFFPPRSHNRSPYRRKSVSGPNGPKI
jgi:hypothetical protein